MLMKMKRPLVALLLAFSFVFQGTSVLAGTTGSLSGTVVDANKAPIPQARVTATSPSQQQSTLTDATGHFTFASLSPDTYTLSVEKPGFDPIAQTGINVISDQSQIVTLSIQKTIKEIGRVTTRASSDLVRSGTTADVYSVNALQQSKFSGLGGGGGLNNAYSAIASVPGAYVPTSQSGYFQTIHIRGGDYDQVGYEVDGVPVNRSFDNYPSGTASSLGQQELQVYTGAAPPNTEGQGLSGFINQVIRTGTYPGFGTADVAIGGPSFYHKASFEVGGASPNRNFSYYAGVGGYHQEFRYLDQFNGQYANDYGPILGVKDPKTATSDGLVAFGPIFTAPFQNGSLAFLDDRDAVANVHFGIPHKNGISDDVQLLYLNNSLQSAFYGSANDIGQNLLLAASDAANGGPGTGRLPQYPDGFQYNGQVGTFLPSNATSLVSNYLFPSSPQNRLPNAPIPVDLRDTYQNNQSIVKLQYQKNFSSDAYLRIYGYTDYSNWLQNGPNFADGTYFNYGQVVDGVSADYELSSHSNGISGTIADQINAQNLLQLQGSYTSGTALRDNNSQFRTAGGRRGRFAVLVNSADPTSGYCYNASDTTTAVDCNIYTAGPPAASVLKLSDAYNAGVAGTPLAQPGVGSTCAGVNGGPSGPCQYFVVENGQFATYNTVKPKFAAGSLTDTIRPNDKLLINLGIRYDFFRFDGSDTTGTPARTLFFNSFNNNECIDSSGNPVAKSQLPTPIAAGKPCPAGYTAANLQNASAQSNSYPVFEPRVGFTYTVNPETVLRGSYGRYAQAPNTAFEQYNTLQQDSPYSLLGTAFYKFGFTTPSHRVLPETSNNYDFSIEHRFKGTDISFKLTPFYRYTQNQIQNFYLDQASAFVSGLNASRLTSRGVEFQLNKGDFGRNGFAGQLAFTYTNAYTQYDTFANGSTVFTGINNDIIAYNAYTSFCATNFNDARCGSLTAAPSTAKATIAGSDKAGTAIANPYYNAPVQPLIDANGKFAPYTLVTGPVGSSANSYLTPYTLTTVLQYKAGPLAFTPSFQFAAGQRYGVPETSPGVNPASCAPLVGATTAGDPRYPYGSSAGAPYDASTCSIGLTIPNPYTGRFDGIGDFVNPSQLIANLQISYDLSKRLTLVGTFANILDNCFGGSKVPWANGGSQVCSYGLVDGGNSYLPVGNAYNPGANIAPALQYPYERSYGSFNTNSSSTKLPFSVYVDARLKL